MNYFLLVSFVFLIESYFLGINTSFGASFVFVGLSVLSMLGAIYKSLEKEKTRLSNLRLIK